MIFIGVSLILDYDYMGQIPQDGNVGQNVVLFKKKKVEPSCDFPSTALLEPEIDCFKVQLLFVRV